MLQQIDQFVSMMLSYRNMYGSGCPLLYISLRIRGFLTQLSLSISFGVKYDGTLSIQFVNSYFVWSDKVINF